MGGSKTRSRRPLGEELGLTEAAADSRSTAGNRDGAVALASLRADQGDAGEEEHTPFPFPRETGPDGERSRGAVLHKMQPWWLLLRFFFLQEFQRGGDCERREI